MTEAKILRSAQDELALVEKHLSIEPVQAPAAESVDLEMLQS